MLGLTRAWILAGARGVIGSHWATPDGNGALFSVFYRALRDQGRLDPAEAFRSAQLQMIRTGVGVLGPVLGRLFRCRESVNFDRKTWSTFNDSRSFISAKIR
jgi:CHAT domain-containing protein